MSSGRSGGWITTGGRRPRKRALDRCASCRVLIDRGRSISSVAALPFPYLDRWRDCFNQSSVHEGSAARLANISSESCICLVLLTYIFTSPVSIPVANAVPEYDFRRLRYRPGSRIRCSNTVLDHLSFLALHTSQAHRQLSTFLLDWSCRKEVK
jgi:hypothetical protein